MTTRLRRLLPALAASALLHAGLAMPVWADDGDEDNKSTPRIEVEGVFEIQSDNNVESDDPDAELSDTFNTTEADVRWIFNSIFSLNAHFTMEPVADPGPGDSRVFEDHGLYAEEFYAAFQLGPVRLVGGKFNASFGQAWDLAPGIYGTDFAEDYELVERVGVAAEIESRQTALGKLLLRGNAFRADRSFLTHSAFNDRGAVVLGDGGVSNTDDLDSFSVTLDGSDIPGVKGLNYHLGYRSQRRGVTDVADERGYVAALFGEREWGDKKFEWITEFTYLDNAEGTQDELTYLTVGGVLTFREKYNIAVSVTDRQRDVAGGPDLDDYSFQVSAGKELGNGWTADIGYKNFVDGGVDNHTIGFLLAKSFEVSTGE